MGMTDSASNDKSLPFDFSAQNLPKKLFINNSYVTAKTAQKLSVYNPKDNSLVADDVPLAGQADVDAAVEPAEKAFPEWKALNANARRDIMLKFAALIEKHEGALSELTRITLGAPCASFGKFEVGLASDAFRYYAGWIDKFVGETVPQDGGFMQVTRNEPLGVTAGIVPWNGPLGTTGLKAAPALATGNCFILKASEKTPFAALALGRLVQAAGFPPGVFQILSGDGATGALIASHMRIRKRVTLELGGKSPAVFFDDCKLENAISWAVDALAANTGQVCFAATRVYVQDGIYEEFVKRYKAALEERAKFIGDPVEQSTLMGPLVDEVQFKRITGFIERGLTQGNLLTGGQRVGHKGFYVQPTVFEGVTSDKKIFQKEIFGPVAVLYKFKTEEEVIA